MIKQFKKIHKNATELAAMVVKEEHKNISEEDLDTLAEAIEILNNTYESLYDEVFVEIDDLK
jgi:acyl-CoA reductase-like NAD-dependent aldehyde dehydrogenase